MSSPSALPPWQIESVTTQHTGSTRKSGIATIGSDLTTTMNEGRKVLKTIFWDDANCEVSEVMIIWSEAVYYRGRRSLSLPYFGLPVFKCRIRVCDICLCGFRKRIYTRSSSWPPRNTQFTSERLPNRCYNKNVAFPTCNRFLCSCVVLGRHYYFRRRNSS